tara:strand:+ start:5960 stop:7204 length:1245 start_codon:yes stop_codon:yes gene_type:complete
MSIKALAGNAAWSMFAHLMGRGSLIAATMILSNKLITSDFATYSYFLLTVSMLSAYAALGMGVTASRYFAEVDVVSDEKLQPLGALWLLSIIIGAIISLVIFLLPTTLISGGLNLPSWLLALGVFVLITGVVPSGGILGLEQYKKYAFFSSLAAVILIVGVLNLPESNIVYIAILLFIASMAIQSLGSSIVVLKKVGFKRIYSTCALNKSSIVSIFSFAGPMVLVSLMAASGSWLVGRIILSGESGEYQFALYSIGLQWFSLVLFIPGMVSRVILPRLVRDAASKIKSKGLTLTTQASFLAAVAAVFTATAGSLLSPFILELYSNEYRVNAWFLIFFMIVAIPASPANTLGNAIVSQNGQWKWLLATFFWFICLVVASLLFVSFGALAGAFAYIISYALLTIQALILAKKMRLI